MWARDFQQVAALRAAGNAPGAGTSRRAVLRALAATASTLALGGCAALSQTAAQYDAAELAADPTLLIATTRKPVGNGRDKPWFGTERSSRMTIARGRLKSPSQSRFSLAAIGLEDWRLEAVEPVGQFGDLIGPAVGPRNVLLYVHGFNQSFEQAALDAARVSDGIRFRGETMVFSWPSKAKLSEYNYDRDSAMWSRDALERVFANLMASPAIGRIHVVAHSVGTMVTLEALRQIYARQPLVAIERTGAVVFASPDIDMDVFTSSVERIGPLAARITVVTATNDRALAVSGWLAGGMKRVGAAEKEQLEQLGLRVIDASQQGWGFINHDLFLSNSEIRQVIRRAIDSRPTGGA